MICDRKGECKKMERISKIFEYSEKWESNCDQGISLFCDFVSSNPHFKYNDTYLKNKHEIFNSQVQLFLYKVEICQMFRSTLEKDSQFGVRDYYVIFDDMLLVDSHNLEKIQYIDDFQSSSSLIWEKFHKSIGVFDLYNMKKNELIVRFWSVLFEEIYVLKLSNEAGKILDELIENFDKFKNENLIDKTSNKVDIL